MEIKNLSENALYQSGYTNFRINVEMPDSGSDIIDSKYIVNAEWSTILCVKVARKRI